jgi:hypothetical protein
VCLVRIATREQKRKICFWRRRACRQSRAFIWLNVEPRLLCSAPTALDAVFARCAGPPEAKEPVWKQTLPKRSYPLFGPCPGRLRPFCAATKKNRNRRFSLVFSRTPRATDVRRTLHTLHCIRAWALLRQRVIRSRRGKRCRTRDGSPVVAPLGRPRLAGTFPGAESPWVASQTAKTEGPGRLLTLRKQKAFRTSKGAAAPSSDYSHSRRHLMVERRGGRAPFSIAGAVGAAAPFGRRMTKPSSAPTRTAEPTWWVDHE